MQMDQTKRLVAHFLQSAAAAVVVTFGGMSVQVQSASGGLATAGTLTCTTTDPANPSAVDAKLSCRFQATSGAEGSFTGHMARKGLADLPPGRRVLVWTVLAGKTDVEPRALAGRYSGETGGQTAGRLKGGQGNSIVLQPVTVTSQVGDNPAPSALELRLEPVRA